MLKFNRTKKVLDIPNSLGNFGDSSDLTDYYNKHQTDELLNKKQDALVSGTNIKTINGNSILGSGDIQIQGEGGKTTNMNFDILSEHVGEEIEDVALIRSILFVDDSVDLYTYISGLKDCSSANLISFAGGEGSDIAYHLPLAINYITETTATIGFNLMSADAQINVSLSAEKESGNYSILFENKDIPSDASKFLQITIKNTNTCEFDDDLFADYKTNFSNSVYKPIFIKTGVVVLNCIDYRFASNKLYVDGFRTGKQYSYVIDGTTKTYTLTEKPLVSSETITSIWSGTQAEYDAIETKSNNILYIIKD